jgi:UDP-3-O-[3-hydroxymyristoyl] glucosamine N-acyltransferase
MTRWKLSDLVRHCGGTLIGSGRDFTVNSLAALDQAGPADVSFLSNPKYRESLKTTRAGAVLLTESIPGTPFQIIRVDDPYLALARILTLLHPTRLPGIGVHPTAVIKPGTRLGSNVRIDANVVVESNVTIGDGTALFPGTTIGEDSIIGNDCIFYPNVTLYHSVNVGSRVIIHAGSVIGSDGFGFAREGAKYIKIPQIGGVTIGDDVEIGACCTIDRGSMSHTRISSGTKLDNMIMLAHNVAVGEDTAIAAQTGISGSTKIGNRVIIAGQVGVVGHIKIGDEAIITAKCGVTKSVPEKTMLSGFPSMIHKKWLRVQGVLGNALKMKSELNALKTKIVELESKITQLEDKKDD